MDSVQSTWIKQAIAAAAATSALYSIYSIHKSSRREKTFPPGPPTTFWLGNLLQVPPEKPFLKFDEWKEEYGDILGLKLGNQNVVVLQSAEHVRELFEKRGTLYSDRTQPWIPSKVIQPDGMLWVNYGPQIRKARSALQQNLLKPAEVRRVLPLQEAHAAILMQKILEDPEELQAHMRHWALATSMLTISGQHLDKMEGSGGSIASFAASYFAAQKKWVEFLTPSTAPPVELLPILKYVPASMAKWKKDAQQVKNEFERMYNQMFRGAGRQRDNMALGVVSPEHESLMAKTIRESERSKDMYFTDREIAVYGSGTLDASIDTVVSTVQTLMLVFAKYPEIQKAAQAELDGLHEDGSIPRGEDLGKLVYLRACLSEAMRWRPATPQAMPHGLARDDVYNGYLLPKGTICIINAWAIQMDEAYYDEPAEYRPQRFLDNHLGVKPSMLAQAEAEGRRATWNFGAGRRMCPGADYAENQVLITVAKLCWAFDITARGPLDVSVETGYHSGMIITPEHLEVDFVPRSDGKAKALGLDCESARLLLSSIDG